MNIGDKLAAEWHVLRDEFGNLITHAGPPPAQTSAAAAAATATIGTSNPGGPVSLSNDLHAIAARLETIGEDGVSILERVKANPETAKVLTALDELTGFNVQPGLIDLVATGLGELVDRLKAAVPADPSQPQFTPAGPSVAGQA